MPISEHGVVNRRIFCMCSLTSSQHDIVSMTQACSTSRSSDHNAWHLYCPLLPDILQIIVPVTMQPSETQLTAHVSAIARMLRMIFALGHLSRCCWNGLQGRSCVWQWSFQKASQVTAAADHARRACLSAGLVMTQDMSTKNFYQRIDAACFN